MVFAVLDSLLTARSPVNPSRRTDRSATLAMTESRVYHSHPVSQTGGNPAVRRGLAPSDTLALNDLSAGLKPSRTVGARSLRHTRLTRLSDQTNTLFRGHRRYTRNTLWYGVKERSLSVSHPFYSGSQLSLRHISSPQG